MPRSDEAAAFFHAVYCAVQEIPHGKVTSYGHIAKLVGTRESPSHPNFFSPCLFLNIVFPMSSHLTIGKMKQPSAPARSASA